MYKYKFTVFTPCYNSANTIHRVIESLKTQTFRDFEWIIVDDGSTDNLYEKIEKAIAENRFPIRFFRHTCNLGKPSAVNLGVLKAEGEFFLPIDADDSFALDALEVFFAAYNAFSEEIQKNVSGVMAHCKDQYGVFIGTPFSLSSSIAVETPFVSDLFEMIYKHKVEGEKWWFVKTDIMKEFPYNTVVDKFVTESTVWFAVANKYKTIFVNKTLRTYYRDENPQRLSKNTKKRYPAGFVYYYQEIINHYMKKMHLSFFDILRVYKNLIKSSLYAKLKIASVIRGLNLVRTRIIAYLCVPLGYLAVYLDMRKERKVK
jgi:glycosyltransferase involved in cell wall biosynthesis